MLWCLTNAVRGACRVPYFLPLQTCRVTGEEFIFHFALPELLSARGEEGVKFSAALKGTFKSINKKRSKEKK